MHSDRDEKILQHVGLYTVSIRRVIERTCLDGADSDNIISRLLASGQLQVNGGSDSKTARLPGGVSYYQLTESAAIHFGFPRHRTKPRGSEALRRDIAVLWFCTMRGENRRRVDRAQLREWYGTGERLGRGLGIPHAVERDPSGQLAVIRLYTPSTVEDTTLVRTLRFDAGLAINHPAIGPWIRTNNYRFAVLVDSVHRQRRLESQLLKHSDIPIQCTVAMTPSLESLHAELRRLNPTHQQVNPV